MLASGRKRSGQSGRLSPKLSLSQGTIALFNARVLEVYKPLAARNEIEDVQ